VFSGSENPAKQEPSADASCPADKDEEAGESPPKGLGRKKQYKAVQYALAGRYVGGRCFIGAIQQLVV
jgi:hypothetical protein